MICGKDIAESVINITLLLKKKSVEYYRYVNKEKCM